MAILVEINGKTRAFKDVIDYLEATEDGFQDIIAENTGYYLDAATQSIDLAGDSIIIDGLPSLPPEEEWEPGKK